LHDLSFKKNRKRVFSYLAFIIDLIKILLKSRGLGIYFKNTHIYKKTFFSFLISGFMNLYVRCIFNIKKTYQARINKYNPIIFFNIQDYELIRETYSNIKKNKNEKKLFWL